MNVLSSDTMLAPDDLTAVMNWIAAQGQPSLGEVIYHFASLDTPRLWRTLGWLIKLGIMRVL